MNMEKEILEGYLWILCNDFVVDRKPRLVYIPSDRKIGIVGAYDAKTETIILFIYDYKALTHEFIHHLQYEECGYDYEEYMKRMMSERRKIYFEREYEIEAFYAGQALSHIYKETFEQGINAEPLGNEELAEHLVSYLITRFTVAESMLEQATDYTMAVISLEDYTRLIDIASLSALAYNEYEEIKYTLKYVARAFFLRWNIPELQDLYKEINEILGQLKICKDIAYTYSKYPLNIKRAETNRLLELEDILEDTRFKCDRLKMHYLDVFSSSVYERYRGSS
jgi:hypothetical protein